MLRIGIDATCWANERGYGRFAREIVSAMVESSASDRFVCFADDESLRRFTLDSENVEIVRVGLGAAASHAASAAGYRSPRDMLAMTLAVARAELDVFFSPSVYTYFPLPPRLHAVVTIHDAIAERFPELTLPSRRSRFFWWLKMRLALLQARRILTVSQYAARDIHRVHGISAKLIDVAVEAPAKAFQPRDAEAIAQEAARHGLGPAHRWFIYVGGFNPHKNVKAIVRAHARLAAMARPNPPHLLLVGTTDRDVFLEDVAGIRKTVADAGMSDLVHWTGFLPDVPLSALHSGAIALLLPSSAEGFGLPAVEAAACGAPVIATTESPLPELLEGGGIFVAPGDEDALLRAMSLLASDERTRSAMASAALLRAAALSWQNAAASAMTSIRAAAA